MNTKEAILNRRSIRKFKSTKISDEMIHDLVEAGYNAPSACNRKPLNFYVVTNEEKLELLNKSSKFSNMPSPLIIIVAGYLPLALPKSMSEYWIQDASAATENILLMATELGLGACWNGVHPQVNVVERIRKILELDENVVPLSLIHIGYMDEEKQPNSGYDSNRVFFIK
jgi:nitroreductase